MCALQILMRKHARLGLSIKAREIAEEKKRSSSMGLPTQVRLWAISWAPRLNLTNSRSVIEQKSEKSRPGGIFLASSP